MSFLVPTKDSRIRHYRHSELKNSSQRNVGVLLPKKGEADASESPEKQQHGPQKVNKTRSSRNLSRASSSLLTFYPKCCHCPCTQARYRGEEKISCCKQFIDCISCPPWGMVSRFTLLFVVFGLLWFFIWSLDKELAMDTVSAVVILELLGFTLGVMAKCIGLPALLASLVLGIVCKNLPFMNFFWGLTRRGWVEPIRPVLVLLCLLTLPSRDMALTIILTRAGVELSPKQIKKLGPMVPLCAFGPCCIEACACAALFYAFFHERNIPIALCFTAGFALSAVSPAVVVPGMLALKKKRYGLECGVHTLLMAASSIDDVLAISAFSVFLSIVVADDHAGSGGEISWEIKLSWVGLIVGILHGMIAGMFLHFIPSRDTGKSLPYLRTIALLLMNFCSTFVYKIPELDWLSGAGSLAVLLTSFVSCFGWRSVPHWKKDMHVMERNLGYIWAFCVPLLFGTIGREMDLQEIGKHLGIFGEILVVVLGSLFIRCCFMFGITYFAHFNKKERLFCALAWIPKATVQCALAPLVVSRLESSKNEDLKDFAKYIVMMAVISVLISAPLGAILITFFGPLLLKKSELPTEDELSNGDAARLSETSGLVVVTDKSEGIDPKKLNTLFKPKGDGILVNKSLTSSGMEAGKQDGPSATTKNAQRPHPKTQGSLANVVKESIIPPSDGSLDT